MRLLFSTFSILLAFLTCAQDTSILKYNVFLNSLLRNHPSVQKAELEKSNINLGLMAAKGAFDPKIYQNSLFKDFNNINYYDLNSTQLSIPSYIGDFKLNYNTAFGQNINPSDYLPSNGLIGMYYTIPLLKGLIIDDRRTELKKQSYSKNIANATFLKNSLAIALVASKYYWDWAFYYHCYQLSKENESLAFKRFNDIKSSQKLGEVAPIDTVEAQTQWLIRRTELIKLSYKFNQYSILLKNFIWDSTQNSSKTFYPSNLNTSQILANELFLINNNSKLNPDLKLYQLKVNLNRLDAKLKKEQLKPKFDAYIGLLSTPKNFNLDYQNRTTGLAFEFPLFLRKERSGYKISQNKIMQSELDFKEIDRKVSSEYSACFKLLEGLLVQIQLFEALESQYKKLLDAETEKFYQGESSVFMINAREQKWVDTRLKKVELITDFYYQIAAIKYIAGTLAN